MSAQALASQTTPKPLQWQLEQASQTPCSDMKIMTHTGAEWDALAIFIFECSMMLHYWRLPVPVHQQAVTLVMKV